MARGSLGTFGEPGIGKGRIVHKESKRVKSPQSPSQGLAFGESEPPGAEAGCNSRPSASSSLGSVGLSCQRALSTDCTVQVGSSRVAPWTGHRPDIDSARLRVEFSVECRHRVLLCQLRRCSGWVKGLRDAGRVYKKGLAALPTPPLTPIRKHGASPMKCMTSIMHRHATRSRLTCEGGWCSVKLQAPV